MQSGISSGPFNIGFAFCSGNGLHVLSETRLAVFVESRLAFFCLRGLGSDMCELTISELLSRMIVLTIWRKGGSK